MIGEPANVECILIADDLTGACDTGVQFVRRGLSCRVLVNLSEQRASALADVLAFNTNSRGDSAERCRQKIEELASGCSHLRANVIFKKVDSTLRGRVAEEIAAALRAFRCEAAILAPGFPAMGRLVREGMLHWADGSGTGQIDIRGLLEQQGVSSEKLAFVTPANGDLAAFASELNTYVMSGKQLLVVDCESQDDLQSTVAAGVRTPRRLLWVGSAGLGIALASQMTKPQIHSVSAFIDAPLLFVIGSTHLATLRQKKRLMAATDAAEVVPTPENVSAARRALRDKRHLVITIEHGSLSESSLRHFFAGLEGLQVAAMFLTGGDTGTLVCNALGAQSIDLRDEIAPGFPWGIFGGGMFRGLPVASKSGAFGEEDMLLRCADFFAPAPRAVR
ncbi:MAG: four-carbon acid sugar kinase family protein [Terriglobales bacterium]